MDATTLGALLVGVGGLASALVAFLGKRGENAIGLYSGTSGRGPACPDGYSLQTPSWDPDALVCRRDGAPQPTEPAPSPTTPAALAPDRRRL
ncbi:hypothetical protein [Streptomyces sparsogenes]|uniref:Collagen triple helix repeat-containing protein n=1 Tax=Streptomyces sparsogenes DSM 40356 TaxID=1331668 RepID=A0A1R1SIV0_9ACTN|nr:collagen triple helix repeat-containing protein [Streptomyces sparsogenes DSM 40356]